MLDWFMQHPRAQGPIPIMRSLVFEYAGVKIDIRAKSSL
jgi:hypothetical protein